MTAYDENAPNVPKSCGRLADRQAACRERLFMPWLHVR